MEGENKQVYNESCMVDGSFAMIKVFETNIGLLLTLNDKSSGQTVEWQFDHDDESPLASQLKEEAKSKAFFKALVKKVTVTRNGENIKLVLKDIVIEDPETKKLRKEREEVERIAKEEAERLAKEEAERRQKEEEELRHKAAEEAKKDEEWLETLAPEEREKVLAERAGLGTSIIDSIETKEVKDYFKQEVHPQLERPEIRPNIRKKKTQAAKTFAELEEEDRIRLEEAQKPKDKVDQDWDDPFDLLADYRKAQMQKNMAGAVMMQMSLKNRAIPEEE